MGEIRIHGRGGQGTVVAAEILATALVLEGLYAASFPFFGVERRGAPVTAYARFGSQPIRERTRVYQPEIVMILDKVLATNPSYYQGLQNGGSIIANASAKKRIPAPTSNLRLLATVDATAIALQETGLPITNTCMLGSFARVTKLITLETLNQALAEYFKGEILEKNIKSMERGFKETNIFIFREAL